MNVGKDSDLVAIFLSHFSKLKNWVGNEPGGLTKLSNDDPSLTELCRKIYSSACELKAAEGTQRELFTERSNPGFIEIWRDFESRYASTLGSIAFSPLFRGGIFKDNESHVRETAAIEADLFQRALEFAERECSNARYSEASSEYFFDPDEDSRDYSLTVEECVQSGLSYWRDFTDATGFDFESVLVRRGMVPFVLVPKHVSDGIGVDEKFSLFTQLKEAHEAFVFGLPRASAALMRSTLETILKKHYGAQGQGFDALAKNVAHLLPENANKDVLDQLWELGNRAIHIEEAGNRKVKKLAPPLNDTSILYFLLKLRELIEAAPAMPTIKR